MSTIASNNRVGHSMPGPASMSDVGDSSRAPRNREASPLEVHNWLRAGEAVLIDVRESDEHARERIGGSLLMPLSRLSPKVINSCVKPGQKLVLHCRSGRRSEDAARMAASSCGAGVEIVSMAGGLEAWKKESLPTEVDATVSRISVMRQVQLTIGLAVLAGSAMAWFIHPGFIAIPAFFGAGLTFAGASGTCALASLIARMPWNKSAALDASCVTGTCGG